MKTRGLIILLCFLSTFLITTKSYPDTEAGQVLTVKKKVYMIREAKKEIVKPQMKLLMKDAVETDKESRTKLFFMDDSILNLGELSRVDVEEYLYSPEKKRAKSIYRLIDGSLKVVVGRSDLEIHTPTAVAAARGTIFAIWLEGIGENLRTVIAVFEGEVLVSSLINFEVRGEEEVLVEKNQMTQVYTQESPQAVTPIPPEIINQFTENTIVMGDTLEEEAQAPETLIAPTTEKPPTPLPEVPLPEVPQEPPITQEPVEAFTPVSIEINFP